MALSITHRTTGRLASYPIQGLLGPLLIGLWWGIDWSHLQPLAGYYFFPLWLGFILTVDGLVEWRTGTSLWRRSHLQFVLLFVASIPFWWFFEWLNSAMEDWHYLTSYIPHSLSYILLSSWAFSTVLPAVLEMGELLASFHVGRRLPQLPPVRPGIRGLIGFELLGWAMVVLALAEPRYAFPLAWLCLFFIIEPFNRLLGQRSIASFIAAGDWAPVWNVMLGTLCTGFFWEMWNFYSMPKWYYTVPYVGFGKIFEMPVLGYGGYLPFGLENFAIFALVFWILQRRPQRYARVGALDDVCDEKRVRDTRPAASTSDSGSQHLGLPPIARTPIIRRDSPVSESGSSERSEPGTRDGAH